MSGMVFIFIIAIIIFAVKLSIATKESQDKLRENEEALDEHKKMITARNLLLEKLKNSLKKNGLRVAVDLENGILRLPHDLLFKQNSDKIGRKGRWAVSILSRRLRNLLNCRKNKEEKIEYLCNGNRPKIEAIFIEGHSDRHPLVGRVKKRFYSNLNLSAQRAINTYELMEKSVGHLKNRDEKYLFSVAGYGSRRPTEKRPRNRRLLKEWDRENRRIDFRFIMGVPEILRGVINKKTIMPKDGNE